MAQADPPPLSIWAVSDGRAGIEAQVEGLALEVARLRAADITLKRIAWKAPFDRLPWPLVPPGRALKAGAGIEAPWPDIWIAAGRATLPLSTRIRRWSDGATFVVQTQDPRTSLKPFDLVIPPIHDGLKGANVFPITGAPNRLTAERMAQDVERFADQLRPLPHPRVVMTVGGTSKAFDLPPARAAEMGAQVAAAVRAAGGSILLSFTRRTPHEARRILTEAMDGLPGWIWNGGGENPYFAFLGAADAVLVTEDSTNLATDAAATGKPVHVLAMTGGHKKFARFHQELNLIGVARPFAGVLETVSYRPLAETNRAARELLRRFDAK